MTFYQLQPEQPAPPSRIRRLSTALAVCAAAVFAVSACSGDSGETPQQVWAREMKAVGATFNNGPQQAFDRAGLICDMKPEDARMMISLVFSDHGDRAQGMAAKYVEVTNKYRC